MHCNDKINKFDQLIIYRLKKTLDNSFCEIKIILAFSWITKPDVLVVRGTATHEEDREYDNDYDAGDDEEETSKRLL